MVSIPGGDSVVAKRVYRNCHVMFPNRVSCVELVELYMFDFDVISSMDWLHACFSSIDSTTRVVKLNIPNESVLQRKGGFYSYRLYHFLFERL